MTDEKRIQEYDFLRAFAIITVVISHVFTKFDQTPLEFEIKEYINTIIRFSVPMFLFLAGVLSRIDQAERKKYWFKKSMRVLIPYFVFAIPGLLYPIIKYNWTLDNYREVVASLLLGYKFGHFYIFVIILMYILGFVVHKLKFTNKINVLLLVTFLMQTLWLIFDEAIYKHFNTHANSFLQFNLQELIFFRNPFTWFFFFVLGLWYQQPKYQNFFKKYKYIFGISSVLLLIIIILMRYFNIGDYTPYGSVIWSIFSTVLIFTVLNVKVQNDKIKKVITYLSDRSYSIYLIHYIFLYIFIEAYEKNYLQIRYVSNFFIFIFIFSISLLIIELIKRGIPKYSKLIIGS